MNVTIVITAAADYRECFRETADMLVHGLAELGHTAAGRDTAQPGTLNIYLGWMNMRELGIQPIPGSIIYNQEYLVVRRPPYADLAEQLANLAKTCQIWDYCEANQSYMRSTFAMRSTFVPMCYTPNLQRIHTAPRQGIDVLFYGAISPRRQHTLDELRAAGINVQSLWHVWGRERDAVIARSKLVLNVHYWPSHPFEEVRVSYLLNNSIAVLAEVGSGTIISENMRKSVWGVHYAQLAGSAKFLLRHDGIRRNLARQGHEIFSRSDIVSYLRLALAPSFPDSPWPPGGKYPVAAAGVG